MIRKMNNIVKGPGDCAAVRESGCEPHLGWLTIPSSVAVQGTWRISSTTKGFATYSCPFLVSAYKSGAQGVKGNKSNLHVLCLPPISLHFPSRTVPASFVTHDTPNPQSSCTLPLFLDFPGFMQTSSTCRVPCSPHPHPVYFPTSKHRYLCSMVS